MKELLGYKGLGHRNYCAIVRIIWDITPIMENHMEKTRKTTWALLYIGFLKHYIYNSILGFQSLGEGEKEMDTLCILGSRALGCLMKNFGKGNENGTTVVFGVHRFTGMERHF